jgi:hypothetical protein
MKHQLNSDSRVFDQCMTTAGRLIAVFRTVAEVAARD